MPNETPFTLPAELTVYAVRQRCLRRCARSRRAGFAAASIRCCR